MIKIDLLSLSQFSSSTSVVNKCEKGFVAPFFLYLEHKRKMKDEQPCTVFELWSLIPFPMNIVITLSMPVVDQNTNWDNDTKEINFCSDQLPQVLRNG